MDTTLRKKTKSAKEYLEPDEELEKSLRPSRFAEIIGREREKKNLEVMIKAAKKRDEAVDHILFYGPPGLGKTTFAYVIANELKSKIFVTSGPALERQGDLASILTNIPKRGILFIDEIHRLKKPIEEMLYPAMEEKALDIIIGKGPSARTLRLDLEDLTIVGATTRIGDIGAPLRSRFGANFRLDFYSEDDLMQIVFQKAKILNFKITDSEAAFEIARRSRGTARIAIQLLKRVRDYTQVEDEVSADLSLVRKVLEMHEIDKAGLDYIDRKLLDLVIDDFDGGPVGLSTISASLSEEIGTITDVYEPYLIQAGFLKRTPRGRVATDRAYKHMNKHKKIVKDQQNLI